MTMDMTELNRLAEQAKRRAIARQAREVGAKQRNGRKDVSKAEYVKGLQRSLRRDNQLVSRVQEERKVESLKDWKRRVGPTFAEANTDVPYILQRVDRLAHPSGRHNTSIVLRGEYGRGKTWQGYAMINEAMSRGLVTAGQIVAGSETQVIERIAAGSFFKRDEFMQELLAERNKIYFIDDVGVGGFSKPQDRWTVWHELIDHVYTHHLTLIITTNLRVTGNDSTGLAGHLGPRAFDRLKTLVGGLSGIVDVAGPNKREGILEQRDAEYRAAVTPPAPVRIDPAVQQAGKLHAPTGYDPE